jgi:hypothetical protein
VTEPLAIGLHFLEDSYDGPPLGAAVALAAAEWGETRGELVAARAPLRLMRLWSRGRPDPAESAAKARSWSDRGWRVQALNEPNLPLEEFPGGPDEHADWFLAVAQRCGAGHRLYFTPMSPGMPDWLAWLTRPGARRALAAAAGIVLHSYGTCGELRAAVEPVLPLARDLGKPVFIAEANFAAGRAVDTERWVEAEYRPFLDWCAAEAPEVEAVCYFAYTWPSADSPLATSLDARGTAVERFHHAYRAPARAAGAPARPAATPSAAPPGAERLQADEVLTYARWAIQRVTEGRGNAPDSEVRGEIGQREFLAFLRAIGADPGDPYRYGWPVHA